MRTIGTPVISAVITTKVGDELKSVTIAKDDELTNLTLLRYPKDLVLETATVKGFTLASLKRPQNTATVYDGIPAYVRDPDTPDVNPGSLFHLAEETTQVDKVIVEVPSDVEGEDPVLKTIPVSIIKSFEGGTPVESAGDDAGTGSDDPSVTE
ncbi:MAG: hypothetical protein NC489_08100 [Ruminococcus flavefaciens]|nr:hypothetical protein [Ruminococcus flavefaciens]